MEFKKTLFLILISLAVLVSGCSSNQSANPNSQSNDIETAIVKACNRNPQPSLDECKIQLIQIDWKNPSLCYSETINISADKREGCKTLVIQTNVEMKLESIRREESACGLNADSYRRVQNCSQKVQDAINQFCKTEATPSSNGT